MRTRGWRRVQRPDASQFHVLSGVGDGPSVRARDTSAARQWLSPRSSSCRPRESARNHVSGCRRCDKAPRVVANPCLANRHKRTICHGRRCIWRSREALLLAAAQRQSTEPSRLLWERGRLTPKSNVCPIYASLDTQLARRRHLGVARVVCKTRAPDNDGIERLPAAAPRASREAKPCRHWGPARGEGPWVSTVTEVTPNDHAQHTLMHDRCGVKPLLCLPGLRVRTIEADGDMALHDGVKATLVPVAGHSAYASNRKGNRNRS
jgi:hypothetical protein